MRLSPTDFDYIRNLLRDHSAIVLDDGKTYLAESRLEALARREGFASLGELVARVRGGSSTLRDKIVDVMTTNETSFFRDLHPFEALRRTLLPALIERRAGPRRLRIWCAASSSGQEPYSVAMLLRDHFPELGGWDVRILATDLSPTMVERTRGARYSQLEVNRGLPAAMLVKYFCRDGLEWTVIHPLRALVEARVLNLATEWPPLEPFDIILMRNVLIYFDARTKCQILKRVARVLRHDGYLLLGGAETTLNLDDSFERIDLGRCGAYTQRARGITAPGDAVPRPAEPPLMTDPRAAARAPRPDVRGVP